MLQEMIKILTDKIFLNAILSTLLFITIGFILRKCNILKSGAKATLSTIVLKIVLPCFAFNAFMSDFEVSQFKNNIVILIFSFVIFVVLLLVSQYAFHFVDKNNYKTYSTFVTLGQFTLFTIPVLKSIYQNNSEILISSNMLTITFRLFLYIYAYILISKIKIDKSNVGSSLKRVALNPVMIGMFLGLIFYLCQNIAPQVKVTGEYVSILRLDKSIPSLYNVIKVIDSLTTPLAMLLIGLSLGELKFKTVFSDKKAYLFAFLRVLIVPLFVFIIAEAINLSGLYHFNEYSLMVLVLGFGAPLSAVLDTYCIKWNNNSYLASDICFLSTIMCFVSLPILYTLVKLVA